MKEGVPEMLRLPGLEMDLARRQARVEGAIVALSPREWGLLSLLARNAGRVVTHRQLLTAVWGPAHAEDVQYLRVYIGQLRQKLGVAARLIATDPGVGYRLIEDDPE
jgi:two-component system KDP operon response regulator KdpE